MLKYPVEWIQALWTAETIAVLGLCAVFIAGAFSCRIYMWLTRPTRR